MKKLKKLSIILVIIETLFSMLFISRAYNYNDINNSAYNDSYENNLSNYSSYDYYIKNYEVIMDVSEDNIYDITETITCNFNKSKHGIKRALPLRMQVKRLDGTQENVSASITNVNVDNEYEINRESGKYIIKIGSADKTVIGEQKYVIHYKYNIGNDKTSNYDELYYNIIGNEWDVPIQNVKFKVTMPKEFEYNYDTFGYSIGKYGTIGNNAGLVSSMDGTTITGEYSLGLNAYNGITIRLQLPEGYFVKQKVKIQIIDIIIIICAVVFTIISYILWKKYGKDDIPVTTVEFYPPEGMNSLDVGYAYDGVCSNKDVISLLIYLADKGYIKIEEYEKDGLLNSKKKAFRIVKVKDYDGNNEMERKFYNGLFKSGRQTVEKDDLQDEFYITINNVISETNKKEYKTKLFEANGIKAFKIIILIIISVLLLPLKLVSIGVISFSEVVLYGIVMLPTFMPILIYGIIAGVVAKKSRVGLVSILMIGIPMILGIGGKLILSIFEITDKMFIIDMIITAISVIAMVIFTILMKKRTKYGTEILGKLQGFKKFLETAEKQKLEALVEKDPKYFYNILPYAYVLGVSNKWIKNFESIAVEPPDWYDGRNDSVFNMVVFNSFMNDTMRSVSNAMTSQPSSSGSDGGFSSGGFSSGGGFSGGGSGGGGGSSW